MEQTKDGWREGVSTVFKRLLILSRDRDVFRLKPLFFTLAPKTSPMTKHEACGCRLSTAGGI